MLPLVVALLSLGPVQDPPAARAAATVRSLPAFAAVATPNRQTELTVRWTVAAAPPGTLTAPRALPEVNRFEVVRRSVITGALPRERDPQIGPDELVVVAVDAQGREVAWHHVKDPRIVRSEQPGPGGLLSGQVLHRTEAELVLLVPESLGATSLRVYEPQADGREPSLRGLGTIAITR